MMGNDLYRTTPIQTRAQALSERARLAGQLLAACVDVDVEFRGELKGWRVIIGRVRSHREMVEDDIFLPEEVF